VRVSGTLPRPRAGRPRYVFPSACCSLGFWAPVSRRASATALSSQHGKITRRRRLLGVTRKKCFPATCDASPCPRAPSTLRNASQSLARHPRLCWQRRGELLIQRKPVFWLGEEPDGLIKGRWSRRALSEARSSSTPFVSVCFQSDSGHVVKLPLRPVTRWNCSALNSSALPSILFGTFLSYILSVCR
jgi:hypothetical protein